MIYPAHLDSKIPSYTKGKKLCKKKDTRNLVQIRV